MIEEAEAQKVTTLQPYVPTRGERTITKVQNTFVNPSQTWHPFFENAYHGGGFAAGLGYMWHVSPYNYVDVRGSYSIRSYKRAEVEFDAPRLFHRRGELTVGAGWRDATEVGFYGLGMDTAISDRANYGFERPAVGALLTVRPTRRLLLLRGGLDFVTLGPEIGRRVDGRSRMSTRRRRSPASARPRPTSTQSAPPGSTGGRRQATPAGAGSTPSPRTITTTAMIASGSISSTTK